MISSNASACSKFLGNPSKILIGLLSVSSFFLIVDINKCLIIKVNNTKASKSPPELYIHLDKTKPIQLEAPKIALPQSQQKSTYHTTNTQQTQKTQSLQTKMTKVYVGKYANFDQAAAIQDALVKSSLVSAPFIKNINGYYVIQVGSFVNMEAAQNVAELLISNGYSAKMVLE